MPDNAWVRCVEHDMELAAAPYADEHDHEQVGHVAGMAAQHLQRWPEHALVFGREAPEETAVWDDLAVLQDEERIVRQRALIEEMNQRKRERMEQRAMDEQRARVSTTPNGFMI